MRRGRIGVGSAERDGSELSHSALSTCNSDGTRADVSVSPFLESLADKDEGYVGHVPSPRCDDADVASKASDGNITPRPADEVSPHNPDPDVANAESCARTATRLIAKGQKQRIRYVRDGRWTLYSTHFNQLSKPDTKLPTHQSPILHFQRDETYLNPRGTTQWRFCAEIAIGALDIQTDAMDIPKYPSTEPVVVLAEAGDGVAFECSFVFLGVGCLKVALPLRVVERAVGLRGKEGCGGEVVEFIGVQSREFEEGGAVDGLD
jgi:hypothetical protein